MNKINFEPNITLTPEYVERIKKTLTQKGVPNVEHIKKNKFKIELYEGQEIDLQYNINVIPPCQKGISQAIIEKIMCLIGKME